MGYLVHFSVQAQKTNKQTKNNPLRKYFLYFFKKIEFVTFQDMELCSPKIKRVLIFSLKKVFLIFGEIELSSPKVKKFQEGIF